jgi:excinuclease ABC subunit C
VAVLGEMNLLEQVKVVSLAKQREEIFLPRGILSFRDR